MLYGVKDKALLLLVGMRPKRIMFLIFLIACMWAVSFFDLVLYHCFVGMLVVIVSFIISSIGFYHISAEKNGMHIIYYGTAFSGFFAALSVFTSLEAANLRQQIIHDLFFEYQFFSGLMWFISFYLGFKLIDKKINANIIAAFMSMISLLAVYVIYITNSGITMQNSTRSFYFYLVSVSLMIFFNILILNKVFSKNILFKIKFKIVFSTGFSSLLIYFCCLFIGKVHENFNFIFNIQLIKTMSYMILFFGIVDFDKRVRLIMRNVRSKVISSRGRMKTFMRGMTLADMETCLNLSHKLMEEAVANEKRRSEFFSALTHEFKTPLNVILSTIQLMGSWQNSGKFDSKEKIKNKYFKIMRQNCFRLLKMVNDLIDINRIESEYFRINLQNTDIVRVVEDITLSVAEYVENKNIQILFDTQKEEKIIACDPYQIERILLNLLSNAVKYTPKEGIIKVSLEFDDDRVYVIVEDTGRGIPRDKLEVIFERYRQAGYLRKTEQEGSGIGLSLVKMLLEKMGGTISVKSELGRGSKFRFSLPNRTIEIEGKNYKSPILHSVGNIESINVEFSDIYC